MSKITRRDFLKTAGVMTLAVAAAGVLSGCEGNANKPGEEVVVTNNSVTVGDYTLTIKETKQFSVKEYDNQDGTSADNKVKNEKRYVAVLAYMKNNDAPTAKPAFNVEIKAKNVSAVVLGANGTSTGGVEVNADGIEKLFDLKTDANLHGVIANGAFTSSDVWQNATAEGTPFVLVVKVDKYEDGNFKTPSISYVANDTEKNLYTKLDVTIPAPVEVTAKQLVNKK